MNVSITAAFVRDLDKLRDRVVAAAVERAVIKLEAADNLRQLKNIKALSGRAGYYRYRVGDYRIGFVVEENGIKLLRCGHRREIYRSFPS